MVKIVNKFIDEMRDKVKEKGIRIKVTNEAIDWLIEKGFDAKMGARPLQRTIDKEIKRDLAKMMLFGELKNGGWLTISIEEGKILLTAKVKTPKLPLIVSTEITNAG